ncbi:MAG: hypothetical protein AAGJ46_10665 [Planctomycetota bacterium]
MLYLDCCRLCKTGPLRLRRCGSCASTWIVCDECDALWTSPDLSASPVIEDSATLPCPGCGASLWAAGSSWATEEQARAEKWIADAIEAGQLDLKNDPL